MKALETRTTNQRSRTSSYKNNLGEVITFLRHPEDKIRVSNGETVNIEIYHNEEPLFLGDKWELFELLKQVKNENTYFQPDWGDDDTLITPSGVELWSYYVYSNYDNAKKDFPDRKIIEYKTGDIEAPYFIDGDKN